MKRYIRIPHLIVLSFIALLMVDCESDEELDIAGIDPFITMQFFNMDSLSRVTELLDSNDIELIKVDSMIDTTTALIVAGREGLIEIRDTLVVKKDELDSIKSSLQSIATTINSGSVAIENISGLGAIDNISKDSATSHRFPLSASTDFTTFYINIADQLDTLEVNYERNTVQENNNIIIEALGLYINAHTYDSIEMFCGDSLACTSYSVSENSICMDSLTCISNEVTIKAYF